MKIYKMNYWVLLLFIVQGRVATGYTFSVTNKTGDDITVKIVTAADLPYAGRPMQINKLASGTLQFTDADCDNQIMVFVSSKNMKGTTSQQAVLVMPAAGPNKQGNYGNIISQKALPNFDPSGYMRGAPLPYIVDACRDFSFTAYKYSSPKNFPYFGTILYYLSLDT